MIKLEAKCDRCGKDYKLYFPKKMNEEIYFNGLIKVTFDTQHNYHRKGNVDLCGNCVSQLISWLDEAEQTNVEESKNESVD